MVYIHNWDEFLQPYELTVQELKLKLEGIRAQFWKKNIHSPIESVRVRVKTINSIIDKSKRMSLRLDEIGEKMHDIAGVRITCQFVEDIYSVVALLKKRSDIEIVYERDYVTYPKDSGYRSYHLHGYYHLETIDGTKRVLFEVQIRTMSMNVWATVEHSLNYKYEDEIPKEIKEKLIKAALAATSLDEQISQIRTEIREAQQQFILKRLSQYTGYDDNQ
jgi:putative GTP pyrophosphokinase